MDKAILFFVNFLIGMLGGCASVISGDVHEINLQSEPPRASCEVARSGNVIANVVTPATLTLKRSDVSLSIACKKNGYQDAVTVVDAEENPDVAMNWIAGFGLISYLADVQSGAAYQYPPIIKITLWKK